MAENIPSSGQAATAPDQRQIILDAINIARQPGSDPLNDPKLNKVFGDVMNLIGEQYRGWEQGKPVSEYHGWKLVKDANGKDMQVIQQMSSGDYLNIALYEKNGAKLAVNLGIKGEFSEFANETGYMLTGLGEPASHQAAIDVVKDWQKQYPNLILAGHSKGAVAMLEAGSQLNLPVIGMAPTDFGGLPHVFGDTWHNKDVGPYGQTAPMVSVIAVEELQKNSTAPSPYGPIQLVLPANAKTLAAEKKGQLWMHDYPNFEGLFNQAQEKAGQPSNEVGPALKQGARPRFINIMNNIFIKDPLLPKAPDAPKEQMDAAGKHDRSSDIRNTGRPHRGSLKTAHSQSRPDTQLGRSGTIPTNVASSATPPAAPAKPAIPQRRFLQGASLG